MKNKKKKAPLRIFVGLDHSLPTPIDMSQYKQTWQTWTVGVLKEVYYWDHNNIRQVRFELWDITDDCRYKLMTVQGVKDDTLDGECINLKW